MHRLAEEGPLFTATYCPFPICVPSRSAFVTSRCAASIDSYMNSYHLPSDEATFLYSFSLMEYETVL